MARSPIQIFAEEGEAGIATDADGRVYRGGNIFALDRSGSKLT